MRNNIIERPIKLIVHSDLLVKKNTLSHYPDVVEEQTLAFDEQKNNGAGHRWIIEEYGNTNTYFIRAYGKEGRGDCLTALTPDFTWQTVLLKSQSNNRSEQLWRIHKSNRGYYRFNNLRFRDKYLAKVPGVGFDTNQDIAMISPPHEIIGIGYVYLNWKVEFSAL